MRSAGHRPAKASDRNVNELAKNCQRRSLTASAAGPTIHSTGPPLVVGVPSLVIRAGPPLVIGGPPLVKSLCCRQHERTGDRGGPALQLLPLRPHCSDRLTRPGESLVMPPRPTCVCVCRKHDPRHSHATQLLAAGTCPDVVTKRLGHSSVAFTLDTYRHVYEGDQSAALKRMVRQ